MATTVAERTLPHNLEAERSVLGAILLHNDAFNLAAEVIDEHDFFRDAHRRIFEKMVRLVERGKVRAAGVCNFDAALLQRCEALRHVDSLQPPFSLIRREVAAAEIPWCVEHGTGVLAYSPMQSGLLTDSFTADRAKSLAPDDWRRRSAEFQQPRLSRNLALRDALRPIAARHGTTVAAVAVAWVLAWPGVTGAIVGARSAAQVDGWIDAATLELSSTDLDEITRAIGRTGAGAGPVRPERVATPRRERTRSDTVGDRAQQ